MKDEKAKMSWRKLDDSAKIFPIMSDKKFSSVFRMSAVLKKQVDPKLLKKALLLVLEHYTAFKVRLRKGFFWYYLEQNTEEPVIRKEDEFPCKYIDPMTNAHYLFKVTYYGKKINLDVFHSLTDGNTALDFLKALLYQYFELIQGESIEKPEQDEEMNQHVTNTEDSYMKHYSKKIKKKDSSKRAYLLKGRKLPFYSIGVTHKILGLKQVIKNCRRRKVSVTAYFTALLIQAIYETNYQTYQGKKPIKICIPVNLKQYFDSTTITNFFSYFTVQAKMKKKEKIELEEILTFVQEEFKTKLTKEKISNTMSANVKLGNNFFVRILPLALKKVSTKISYIQIRKYTTTTLSNMGKVNLLPKYREEVEQFMVLIAPEKGEKIKCSTCSYGDYMIFTFTSILENAEVEKRFGELLEQDHVIVQTKTNDRYGSYDKTWYPKVSTSVQRGNATRNGLLAGSILLGLICVLIDYLTRSSIHWSMLCIVGIVYCWITVLYAIRKNINIASHVMIQAICISIFSVAIDWIIGYQGWSMNYALPIVSMVANITLLILYFVTRHHYVKYIIYQLIVFLLSMIPLVLEMAKISQSIVLVSISTGIAVVTFILTLLFSGKEMMEEIKKRFSF